MAIDLNQDPDLEWVDLVPPVGLVVAPSLLKDIGLAPTRQTPNDSGLVAELIGQDATKPVLTDPWAFMEQVLGWEARHVAGAPGGPPLEEALVIRLPEHDTTLQPTWAVTELGTGDRPWQLLVRVEAPGVDPGERHALDGWEASPQQRFERLLRDTGVFAGLLISERERRRDGTIEYVPELRLIYAPRGETSGHQSFPVRPMGLVAGRPILGGLKLLLDRFRLFSDADDRRLPALLKRSRDAQASVSTALSEQVLGALHELLRGLDSADAAFIRDLADRRSAHLYEGLLTVLMRLVFVLYAEDRDLIPSRTDARAREVYEASYSVRGLYAKLTGDAAVNPDTMDERRGAWGRLLALFRLIHGGHPTRFVLPRGGKLFDPEEFPFLEGRVTRDDAPRILNVSDGCLLRVLAGLMTLRVRGGQRQRLSYRALDVEQIGSVYETVMGFTVEVARNNMLAIKAGKNNRTPVFVGLDDLLAKGGKERLKELKDGAGRALSAAQKKPIQAAKTIEQLATALDSIVDERGSPRHAPLSPGTPILQPTNERRRTGSHYTPRTLTAPIVKHALEPAFERLGADATPEQVLELKVCDPAMGSGAFLVEACRVIGERLVAAWGRWAEARPVIPADEDEELHARRLVAQRCLYGVDKNPRAVDLARLSLWLATLAKDHEFTFLDHALKCGDSLVGLTSQQIASAAWDNSKPALPLFRQLVKDRVSDALAARAEIQMAPDDTRRATQEARHAALERNLTPIRIIGDAIVSAFFAADKAAAREKKRAEVESWLAGSREGQLEKLTAAATTLRHGTHAITPFHWEIEFPEVFTRENSGFDAIVGNPPFAGKNTLAASHHSEYGVWLQTIHHHTHGNADLVAHFFRRAFILLRHTGVFGLIATNTIGQGDTRSSGLTEILSDFGVIARATRRYKWPGEAAVIVSIIHVSKGPWNSAPVLDTKQVSRISAYLVEGDLDRSPKSLSENSGRAFQGSILLGMGFTFDDVAASKGQAEDIAEMRRLIDKDPKNKERIFPYLGGEEVNTDPRQAYRRFAIDFFDRPLRRELMGKTWSSMDSAERAKCRVNGIVPEDYPDEVAEDWPDLIEIVRRRVKPERDVQKRDALRERWWQYAEKRPGLVTAITGLDSVLSILFTAPHLGVSMLKNDCVFANTLNVFAFQNFSPFCVLQSRVHEVWAWFFSSTLEDRLRYTPSDCFRTFPLPDEFSCQSELETKGRVYHDLRSRIMLERNQGMTKTYNRFHSRTDKGSDIVRLRELHADMDAAVLRTYGWDDLAVQSRPEFVDLVVDEGKKPKTRLDWPAQFKDAILARLLARNADCAAAEAAAGLPPPPEGDDEDEFEGEGEDSGDGEEEDDGT